MRRPFLDLLDAQPAIERNVLRALARRLISDSREPSL
jgi:CRP-like cAMP-binding protein